jgi:signal transduction histidine kinase
MLTFSRKQIVLLEPIPLNSVIAGMRDMLCRLAGEDIRMNILLNPQELVLNADRGQLQQVLLNLYNNARDAMPGGGCLTIATSSRTVPDKELNVPPEVPPGRYILLTVSDTGCGIPAEDLKRIFDPFFTTKEVGKGTGLGLSMVFGIVQQHEGHITVDSTPGLGTVFSVWFPEYDVKDGRDSEHATALGGV